jgi:general secretion pathway protein D
VSVSVRVISAALAVFAILGVAGCSQTLAPGATLGPTGSIGIFSDGGTDGSAGKSAQTDASGNQKRSGPVQAEIYDGGGVESASASGRDEPSRSAVTTAGSGGRIVPVAAVSGEAGLLRSNGARTREGVSRTGGDGINLNFDQAEIKTVARAILGEVLDLNYAVDPRVTGTISLSTQRPVPRAHVLSLLETALRAQGAVIVRQKGVHRIVPGEEAAGLAQANLGRDAGGEGYAITALPLENISADALMKILDGFGARSGAVRIDTDRNMLVVQGTYAERQSLIDTALAFDVDWMRNQSVGIFPVQNANPETVISELNRMVDRTVVRFQPIGRMNAILAVSTSPQAIRQVSTWVGRLDRANESGARVRVFPLKYGDARQVTKLVREIFGSGGPAQSSSSAADQVAPGGGTATARVAALPGATQGLQQAGTRTDASEPIGDESAGGVASENGSGDMGASGSGKIRITADLANNAVVVFSSQEHAKLIEQAILDLDRAPVQVAIEATIAEITLNDNLNNGVQFYLTSGDLGLGKGRGSVSHLLDSGLPLDQVVPGFNLLLGSATKPKVVIDALRKVTNVKILSSPSLVVVNNQPAVLQVGDQVPVTTRSAQDVTNPTAPVVNSIDFRDTGVILRVTPRVQANSTIGIDVEQEISAVKDADAETLTPTISQRRVKSTVSVADAQTLLIGGLISEQRTKGRSGIPGLVEVPVLGEIFANNQNENARTELIIFIRPQLIRNREDARQVAEGLRQRMKGFQQW